MSVRALCKAECVINLSLQVKYILVKYGLLEVNRSFGKSLQISGLFQDSVTLNPNSMSASSSNGELKLSLRTVGCGRWKQRGGKWNCPFETELCHPGCGGNAESICSQLGRESKSWGTTEELPGIHGALQSSSVPWLPPMAKRAGPQLWRGRPLGDCHCQAHVMPFEDGFELITSLNDPRGPTAQCWKLPQATTPLCPFLSWRELHLGSSLCNQQREGEWQGSSVWHQEDLSGSPPAPSACK